MKKNALQDLANIKPLKPRMNPKLGHPETDYQAELGEKAKAAMQQIEGQKNAVVNFPFHAFPAVMQRLLKVFYDSSGFAPEYYFSNLISVAAMSISNKYRIKAKSDFIQPAIFYMVNMGKSGIGKSGPQKTIWMPLFKIQKEKIAVWRERHKHWQVDKEEAAKAKMPFDEPEPMVQKMVFEYATVEALWEILTYCQHGFSLVDDEISGWVEAMGQYSNSKGPEVAFWLKNYDNPSLVIIERKGQPTKYIYNSAVNINGNIQPGVVKKLAEGDKGDNGFFARFLLTMPSIEKINTWNEIQPDPSVYQKYGEIINFLYELPSKVPDNIPHIGDVKRIDFPLSAGAKEKYIAFYNSLAARMNTEEDDKVFSQLSKYRGTCLRFALVMDMLHFACEHYDNDEWAERMSKKDKINVFEKHEISPLAMDAAIALTNYYIQTSMNVLAGFDNVLNTYKPEIRAWYHQLPNSFKGRYAVELATEIGMGTKSTVYRFLKDKNLFKKNLQDDLYYKLIAV